MIDPIHSLAFSIQAKFQEQSPFVKIGIFGETVERCSQGLDVFKVSIPQFH